MRTHPEDLVNQEMRMVQDGENIYISQGLNKQEYFAIMALQGILARSGTFMLTPDEAAQRAVEYSEALFNKLNKEKSNE